MSRAHEYLSLNSSSVDPADAQAPCANPICPRCGYDLSGPIPDWLDACPLSGTCPECGESFEYRNVFHPERLDVPHFIEHARSRPGDGFLRRAIDLTRASCSTCALSLAPWLFFRRIRIAHRIEPKRWLLWCIIMAVPLHLAASALSMFRVYWLGPLRLGGTSRDEWMVYVSAWTYPIFAIVKAPPGAMWSFGIDWEFLGAPTWVFMALAMHFAYALTILALPTTVSRAKLSVGHIARAATFGLSWCLLLILFRLCRNGYMAIELLGAPQGPAVVNGSLGPRQVITLARGGFRAIPRPYFLGDLNENFMAVLLLSFVAAWWLTAMLVGWKLERGRLVFLLLSIIALLAAACVSAWRS